MKPRLSCAREERAAVERLTLTAERVRRSGAAVRAYFAAAIDSTLMVLLLASSVPATVTFLPANFSGVC